MKSTELYSTYSILAVDAQSGRIGGAVQTHQMCVGAIIPSIEPGIGAVASQSFVNFTFPETALAMMRRGIEVRRVIKALVKSDAEEEIRQVGILNAAGEAAVHTGGRCIPEASHFVGPSYCIQANMMSRPTVVDAMRTAFESSGGESDLGHRLLTALQAAQKEDGDIRGMQSAALLVLPNEINTPRWKAVYDLRVDESADPVFEMSRLVRLRSAQLLDEEGERLYLAGEAKLARRKWQAAREKAPELEELAFWQAMSIIGGEESPEALAESVDLLTRHVRPDPRWAQWRSLIERLDMKGFIKRPGAAKALLEALEGK
ncbi:MAG: DUF1028 domain-containing protein [Spirochaetaceae bacterium]|nr:DUF1028 domain-containing protein [Spirochaetaceae bacterium]MDT8299205.1 DUF1028 domain-containing protein [Spirochaetaceae bacterium]